MSARSSLFVAVVLVSSLLLAPQAVSALDHFMCYKSKQSPGRICSPASPANAGAACADDAECGGNAGEKTLCVKNKFEGSSVFLTDALESLDFRVGKPLSLCAPANKNDEDPAAPTKPDHLQGYKIKPSKVCSDNQQVCTKSSDCNEGAKCSPPKHQKTLVVIEDQLGRLVLETKKADRLLTPTAKDHDNPIAPLASPAVGDHKCYAAVAKKKVCENDPTVKCKTDEDCAEAEVDGACSQGFPKGIFVSVEDQLQSRLYELKKPTRYCPQTIAGLPGGAPVSETYLTCYQAKPAKGVCDSGSPENAGGACAKEDDCGGTKNVTTHCVAQPKHVAVTTLHVNNQIGGASLLDTIKEEELCIPELQEEVECDALAGPPVTSVERADLNDDGVVDQADVEVLTDPAHFGKVMGEVGYIDNLDIAADTIAYPTLDPGAPDGRINQADVDAVRLQCGASGVPTDPTTLSGFVYDTEGNPLEGVGITGGQGGLLGSTSANGSYAITVDPSDLGLGEINFLGGTAIDPTPGGSGEFPTIPHKPIFLNGGLSNTFRNIYLPERDLTGAVVLDGSNSVESGTPGARTTTAPVVVNNFNIGTTLQLPAGCTVLPPPGEGLQLSIASLPTGNIPVPPPPGLSSSMFITLQPGGTQIDCSGGSFVVTFDNVDLLPAGSTPDLYGVENGAFAVVASCSVVDSDSDSEANDPDDTIVCGVTTPFTMAWYAAIPPGPPCPLTLVAVEALCNGVPLEGANVSIGSAPACTANSFGVAGFVDMPAGPSGPACLLAPFEYTALVWDDSGNVGSGVVTAVPGGVSAIDIEICEDPPAEGDVGDIANVQIEPVVFGDGAGGFSYPYILAEIDFHADFPIEPGSVVEFYFTFGLDSDEIYVECYSIPFDGSGSAVCDVLDFGGVLPFPDDTVAQIQWDFAGSLSRFQFFIGIDLDTEDDGVSHSDIFGEDDVEFSLSVYTDRPPPAGELIDDFPNSGPIVIDVTSTTSIPDPPGDQYPIDVEF